MKKLFTIVCLLVSVMAKGQGWPGWDMYNVITFDPGSAPQNLISLDTTYHRNNWQIGKPQKAVFDSALSLYNALVTDTVNACSPDDTSVVIFRMPISVPNRLSGATNSTPWGLTFKYKLDIGAGDSASIELSTDGGVHWIDSKDTLPFGYGWSSGSIPDLSPGDTGWRQFALGFMDVSGTVDTLLFRFTLITDTSSVARDGWMVDDINLMYLWEGSVSLLQNPNLIILYPNPTHGNLYIHTDKPHKDATIAVHDMQGRQVYSGAAPANGYLNLQMPNGMYTLKYSDEEEYCVKQIVIQN